MVPPVFFKRKGTVARILTLWTTPRLEAAGAKVDEAVVQSRLKASIGTEIATEALLALATAARAPRAAIARLYRSQACDAWSCRTARQRPERRPATIQ